jgi:hypothetical protein
VPLSPRHRKIAIAAMILSTILATVLGVGALIDERWISVGWLFVAVTSAMQVWWLWRGTI